MNDKKIVILGRSGSGKDTVACHLINKYGLKQLISTTTRAKRFEDEDTHIFVTKEEAARMTDRVASTVINGYEYFATREQFEACDIYLIDPNGLDYLVESCPNVPLIMVYVDAKFTDRYHRAIARGEDPDQEKEIFRSRNASENERFSNLESLLNHSSIKDLKAKYPTITTAYVISNRGTLIDLYAKVDSMYQEISNDFTLQIL